MADFNTHTSLGVLRQTQPATGGPNELKISGLLSTKEAAAHLGLSPRTLDFWRHRGCGPRWRRIGAKAIRYALEDLIAFAASGDQPGGAQ